MRIEFVKLYPDAFAPRTMTEGSSGYDLFANLEEDNDLMIPPGGRASIGTGIALSMPPQIEGQVRSRSGLAKNSGVVVLNSPGTIDSDYRGEIRVLLINLGKESINIRSGDRIAQLVFNEIHRAVLSEVEELDKTQRGSGGFGSTGV